MFSVLCIFWPIKNVFIFLCLSTFRYSFFLSTMPRVVTKLTDKKHTELLALVNSATVSTTQDKCRRVRTGGRLSFNKKGYVQIKVKTPGDITDHTLSNTKVQLHQLICWNHPNDRLKQVFQTAIRESTLEISHLCPNKDCCEPTHFCVESPLTNKSRKGCPAVIFINDIEYGCCRHNPKCIPDVNTKKNAFRYVV